MIMILQVLKADEDITNSAGQLPIELIKNKELRREIEMMVVDGPVVSSPTSTSSSSNPNPSSSPSNAVAAARLLEGAERERG